MAVAGVEAVVPLVGWISLSVIFRRDYAKYVYFHYAVKQNSQFCAFVMRQLRISVEDTQFAYFAPLVRNVTFTTRVILVEYVLPAANFREQFSNASGNATNDVAAGTDPTRS